MDPKQLRNIAIIAHVDHGKTTLVDRMLQLSGVQEGRLADGERLRERMMDSGDLERERGITILSKNTAINWQGMRINIVDTPGHADFGGEVERVLSMVDSVLLLVDAVDGPMPQTRFVTKKAFARGLNPILVVNKVDRDGARPHEVIDEVFDLFDNLGATDEQLDFPIVYASALNGQCGPEVDELSDDFTHLLEVIRDQVSPPQVDLDGPFQMQVSSLDYSSYKGVMGIGRIRRGSVKTNTPVTVLDADGQRRNTRVLEVMVSNGLEREAVNEASAGDIVCVTGVEGIGISDTLCDPGCPEALDRLTVDEPTMSMTFQVNTSPLSGKDGKYLTSRQIRERLVREASHNVALRIEDTDNPDAFKVSGRGELHLSVLIETMRREGYEVAVSRPQVITREVDGVIEEPYEDLVVDIEEQHQGAVMQELGDRRAELKDMVPDGKGRVRMTFVAPARALMGLRPMFLSMTSGSGIMTHVFREYGPRIAGNPGHRNNGVLISAEQGKAVGFALFNLQARGRLMVDPGDEVYEGMVVGIHSRGNDLTVNPLKEKKLTNIRAAGTDENIQLATPVRMTLEQALEFIEDDELVEVTPAAIRVRKRFLKEHERKRESRQAAG